MRYTCIHILQGMKSNYNLSQDRVERLQGIGLSGALSANQNITYPLHNNRIYRNLEQFEVSSSVVSGTRIHQE